MSELSKRQNDTGTDRVELTDAEREALWQSGEVSIMNCDYDSNLVAAVESIVAARVAALTAERDELEHDLNNEAWANEKAKRDLDAARAEVDELRREIQAVAGGALVEEAETSVRRIHAEVERDVARQALTSADAMNRHWDEINAHRDLLVTERDALQATLDRAEEDRDLYKLELDAADAVIDRVTALADEWHERACSGESIVDGMFNECEVALRAALTPEGDGMSETPKYRRGIDPMPAGTYQENDDGTYSPAVPYEPPPIRFYLRRLFQREGKP